jgi:hypothetical protein
MFGSVCLVALIVATEDAIAASPAADTARVDHLILGTNNLERAMDAFARLTGVRPVFGGRHPGRGTANALISLGGGTYLEILGPASTHRDSIPPNMAGLDSLTPYGWALGTRDLAGLSERLKAKQISLSPTQAGSRRKPDNSTLSWRSASPTGAGLEAAPFFIEWGAGTAHPSTTSPTGCRLARLVVFAPDPGPMTTLLQTAGVAVPVERGATGLAFSLNCPHGSIEFGRR